MRLLLVALLLLVIQGTSSWAEAQASKFDSIFSAFSGAGSSRDTARAKILQMSPKELAQFLTEAQARLKSSRRDQVVSTFDIVRRRKDFNAVLAKQMKDILSQSPAMSSSPTAATPTGREVPDARLGLILEVRLALILDAKTGQLNERRIADELKIVEKTELPSALRLSRLTGLTDAMESIAKFPTAVQLETLLENDIFEVRMHAVDWFRLRPPAAVQDRGRFLKAALSSNVLQVRERAFQTLASWPAEDVLELKKEGGILPQKCGADTSQVVRKACGEIREKAGAP